MLMRLAWVNLHVNKGYIHTYIHTACLMEFGHTSSAKRLQTDLYDSLTCKKRQMRFSKIYIQVVVKRRLKNRMLNFGSSSRKLPSL